MTVPRSDGSRRFIRRLAILTAVAAALRLFALADQPPLADDVTAAVSAVNFVERAQVGPTMWQHPRLRDLLVYASISVAGSSKLGLVLPSLLLGLASIPAVGLLARRLGGERAGLLAALLVAIDPLHVDYSRQAVQEVYTAFFGAAGVVATLRHHDSGRARWAVAAGVAFGLGLASKWSVAFPMMVALAWSSWRVARDPALDGAMRGARAALVVAAFALLPAAVYLATWAPWFAGGRGLADWLRMHLSMVAETTGHAGFNVADAEMPHRAVLWFLRPVYYADSTFGPSGPIPIVAITHPLTWLPTLPAIGWLAKTAWSARDPERALLPLLVLATWLPFAVASRPIWLHSALAVLPFALSAVAVAASAVAGSAPAGSRRLKAYAVAAAVVAMPLWLLASGLAFEVPLVREAAMSFRPAASVPRPAPR